MSDNHDDMGGTKPVAEHAWLQQLVGDWTTESEMMMGPGETMTTAGTERVTNLGGLWSFVFHPAMVALPVPGVTGIPFAYAQYRVGVGLEFGAL